MNRSPSCALNGFIRCNMASRKVNWISLPQADSFSWVHRRIHLKPHHLQGLASAFASSMVVVCSCKMFLSESISRLGLGSSIWMCEEGFLLVHDEASVSGVCPGHLPRCSGHLTAAASGNGLERCRCWSCREGSCQSNSTACGSSSQPHRERKPCGSSSQPYWKRKPLHCSSQPHRERKPLHCSSQPYWKRKPLHCSSQPYWKRKPLHCSSQPYWKRKPFGCTPRQPYWKRKPFGWTLFLVLMTTGATWSHGPHHPAPPHGGPHGPGGPPRPQKHERMLLFSSLAFLILSPSTS